MTERKAHKLPHANYPISLRRDDTRAFTILFIRKTAMLLIVSAILQLIGAPMSETMPFFCASAALFAVVRSYAAINPLEESHFTHFDEATWLYMLALVWRFEIPFYKGLLEVGLG